MQPTLHNRREEHNRYDDRCHSTREQRNEQHLLLNAIVYEEIEIGKINSGKGKADCRHGLISPFPKGERDVGEPATYYDAAKNVPVEINEICFIKAEYGGGIAMFKHVLRSHKSEEYQIDERGSYHVAVGEYL